MKKTALFFILFGGSLISTHQFARLYKQKEPAVRVAEPSFHRIYTRNEIFADAGDRIGRDFSISRELRARVSFWFDIYTRYPSQMKVVHHKDHPWVVLAVIDSTGVPAAQVRRHQRREEMNVVRALKSLSKKKTYRALSGLEAKIYRELLQIPGPRKKVIADTLKNLRTQTGQKDHFLAGLRRGSALMPALEDIFREEGLPVELTRLPLLESSFNKKAVSKVGASGIWQIMPAIGKKLMLVEGGVDERNSPLKATRVAARLMRSNHRILQDWPLAVTAYNHGPMGLLRAKQKHRTGLAGLIQKHKDPRFGFASKNFYAGFLAALHAEKYKHEIFGELPADEPLRYEIYHLKNEQRLAAADLMDLTGAGRGELLSLNYDLREAFRDNRILPKKIMIYLPVGAGIRLTENLRARPPSIQALSWLEGDESSTLVE